VAVEGWPHKHIDSATAKKKIIWQVFQRQYENSKYRVNSANQHLNKVMGQLFGGGASSGGAGVRLTYSGRRRRKKKLFAKDF
jgi:hypothetical protein